MKYKQADFIIIQKIILPDFAGRCQRNWQKMRSVKELWKIYRSADPGYPLWMKSSDKRFYWQCRLWMLFRDRDIAEFFLIHTTEECLSNILAG